jgi:hypothetical protein
MLLDLIKSKNGIKVFKITTKSNFLLPQDYSIHPEIVYIPPHSKLVGNITYCGYIGTCAIY